MLNAVENLSLCRKFKCPVTPAWKILGKNKRINVQKDVNLQFVQDVLSAKIGICLLVQMESLQDTLRVSQ